MRVFIVMILIFSLVGCASNRFKEKEVFIGNKDFLDEEKVINANVFIEKGERSHFSLKVTKTHPVYTADVYRIDEIKGGGINGTAIFGLIGTAGLANLYNCSRAAGGSKEGWEGCRVFSAGETKEGSELKVRNRRNTGRTEEKIHDLSGVNLTIFLNGSLVESIETGAKGQFVFKLDEYGVTNGDTLIAEGVHNSNSFRLSLQ
tara:strand:- start:1081 stop:1689 length:609 start_codon:yes stop_codon:yes gene_type:complete